MYLSIVFLTKDTRQNGAVQSNFIRLPNISPVTLVIAILDAFMSTKMCISQDNLLLTP